MKTISRRKKIAFVLVAALLISTIPFLSMAGQDGGIAGGSADQIGKYVDVYGELGNTGGAPGTKTGSEYPDSLLTATGNNDLYVKYSKEIEGTDTENEFKINLNVTTNDTREEYTQNGPTDLILIMDVSGSMDEKNVTTSDGKISRWEIYKPAMIDFVNTFMEANPENQISIIAFTGNSTKLETYYSVVNTANPKSPIVHYNLTRGFVSTAQDAIKTFDFVTCTQVRREIQSKMQEDTGKWQTVNSHTNAQAGFRGGHEALGFEYDANDNATILFVSDGNPNEAYEYVAEKDMDYSLPSADKATAVNKAVEECGIMMKKIKKVYKNAELYTYAVGTEAANSINSKMMSENHNSNVTKCFTTADLDIAETFEEIVYEITHSVRLWTVKDPMSEWVTFKEFDDNDGGNASESNGLITWELGEKEKNSDGTYTYNISYYVTLDTNHPNFVEGEFYPTNKETSLKYSFSYDNGSSKTDEVSLFRIPTVKGEKPKETFSFTKAIGSVKGEDQSSSDKFSFLVTANNEVYKGDYKIGDDSGSTDNGIITITAGQTVYFANVPVWTTFEVSEIDMPSFYSPIEQTKKCVVKLDGNNSLTFTNNYDKPEVNATKSGSVDYNDTVWHGDEITYTIKVTNDGETTAKGIAVRDSIPTYTKYLEGSVTPTDNDNVTGGYNDGGYVHWFIEEMLPNDSVELKFTVTVDKDFTWEDLITNQATYSHTGKTSPEAVSFNEDFKEKTEVVTNIPPLPSMNIEKSNSPDNDTTVKRGDEIEYTIKIINTGTPDLKNVWVKDYIPAGTTYVNGSASDNGSYNSAGYVEWVLDSVASGSSKNVTFKVTVNNDASDNQDIANTALGEHLGYDERGDKADPGTESNPVHNYVTVPEVAGEKAAPTTTKEVSDSTVLGEEAEDEGDDGTVLGEEAKTQDVMNMIWILLAVGAIASVILIIVIKTKSKKE